jgi:outer membrane immunogenic protein
MKWRNSYALVAGCAVVGLTSFNAQAQSVFAGFYGQLSTGYESNQLGSQSDTSKVTPYANSDSTDAGPSRTFGSAPLVLGAGYYWQASEKWLIGLGADYSALKQVSPSYSVFASNAPGSTSIGSGQTVSFNGISMQLSNRLNLFVTPGYAIDKDKLVYLKAGYSQVNAQYNLASSVTRTNNGVSNTFPGAGGNLSSNQSGYILGLGYKQIITKGLYGFVEGNYMGYSAPSYSATSPVAINTNLLGISATSTRAVTINFASLNTYQVLAGLGYAF